MSRQLLEQIRDELISCGVISSNKEFCESWLARDSSYLRGLKFRGLEPTTATLTICASKLGYYARHIGMSEKLEHRELSKGFTKLRSLCEAAIEQQARARWMTPERMGL